MNKPRSTVLAAAVSGILMGGMTSCASTQPMAQSAGALAIAEKHACKGMNTCSGKGGCKTEANACAGKNKCEGKGGCATVAAHDCATKNSCRGLGGCKTDKNACKGKNECKGKGGCHVGPKK